MQLYSSNSFLKVVDHPFLGKTCVAARDIQYNERFMYIGKIVIIDRMMSDDYMLTAVDQNVIQPDVECCLTYSNAHGPNETSNIAPVLKTHRLADGKLAQEFRAIRKIPKNTQIVWNYGGLKWFSDRGITRLNVGTKEYPAPQSKRRRQK